MSKKLYLICDTVGSTQLEILQNESSGSDNSSLRFRGKFQEADTINKNKRKYSYDILSREAKRLDEVISERRLFGELDHPSDSIIHLENASHLITKLWWNKNTLMGEGEILPTPAGKILEAIVRASIPVGISSRGVGTGKLNNEGIMIIDPNYKLITFDVVADPSTPKAFAEPILVKEKNQVESFKTEEYEKNAHKNNNTSIHTNTINENVLLGFLRGTFNKHKK